MSAPTTIRTASDHPPAWPAAQRAGGLAALVAAATYIVGFVAMGAYLAPRGFTTATADPVASLDFLLGNRTAMYVWYLLLYVVGGIALTVLVLGVHDRVVRSRPVLGRVGGALGLLWAGLLLASGLVALVGQRAVVELAGDGSDLALGTWVSVSVVQDALGGGIEVVGAAWVIAVSWAALLPRRLSMGLVVLGLLTGAAGLATLVPAAADAAGSAFGLGFVVWFLWAGVELLRR
jgi:hypothetical protein